MTQFANQKLPSLGIDIGSTTAKVALIENGELVYQRYERHYSFVRQKTLEMIRDMRDLLCGRDFTVAVSGSSSRDPTMMKRERLTRTTSST